MTKSPTWVYLGLWVRLLWLSSATLITKLVSTSSRGNNVRIIVKIVHDKYLRSGIQCSGKWILRCIWFNVMIQSHFSFSLCLLVSFTGWGRAGPHSFKGTWAADGTGWVFPGATISRTSWRLSWELGTLCRWGLVNGPVICHLDCADEGPEVCKG